MKKEYSGSDLCPWCKSNDCDLQCDYCGVWVCYRCYAAWEWVGDNDYKLLEEGKKHLRVSGRGKPNAKIQKKARRNRSNKTHK